MICFNCNTTINVGHINSICLHIYCINCWQLKKIAFYMGTISTNKCKICPFKNECTSNYKWECSTWCSPGLN